MVGISYTLAVEIGILQQFVPNPGKSIVKFRLSWQSRLMTQSPSYYGYRFLPEFIKSFHIHHSEASR